MAHDIAPVAPADAPLFEPAVAISANRPQVGYYRNLAAMGMDEGVGKGTDKPMSVAARANRVLALNRIRDARWPSLAFFRDVIVTEAFHAGDFVSEVHGDAGFGKPGPQR